MESFSGNDKEVDITETFSVNHSTPERLEDMVDEEYRHFKLFTNILYQGGLLIFLFHSEMLKKIER